MAGRLPHRWSIGHNYLAGITAGAWWRLLRENRFAVSPAYWHRAAFVSALSVLNSGYAWREVRRYGAAIAATRVKQPPIFILGHWRSGTTHLHNLLAQDAQFAFPNTYQVVNPATFLTTEQVNARRFAWLVPKPRVEGKMWLCLPPPQEEGGAPAPPAPDRAAWKAALLHFLKKLTLLHGQSPLLLKSPSHTAKIRLLLELFPDARFVHIHRHPYEVYQSQLKFADTVLWYTYLQRPDRSQLSEEILERYRALFAAYFHDQPLIPAGHFHELSFTELESDPVGALRRTYGALGLAGFDRAQPGLERYVGTLRDYEKNRFAPLDAATRARVDAVAAPCFERWGYRR